MNRAIYEEKVFVLGNKHYNIIGMTVKGNLKEENQDSYSVYHDDKQIIISIADGLGSAKYSKEGARKITNIAISKLRKNYERNKIINDIVINWKKEIIGDLYLFNTTLKFLKITKYEIIYGGIGDGWISVINGEEKIDLIVKNAFSNQTDSILSGDLGRKFVYNEIKKENNLLGLISTDGFSEDMRKDDSRNFLCELRDNFYRNKSDLKKELVNMFENWPVETNKDDKTAVFIIEGEKGV